MRHEIITDEATAARLLKLMERCGIKTTQELMSYATATLEWAVDESERGHVVAALDRKQNTFVAHEMPLLETIRKRTH